MITVRSFLASPESFAPYSYVCKYITNLNKRYAELAKHLGFQDNLDTPNFGWLNIHICEHERCKKSLHISNVISKKGYRCIEDKGEMNYRTLGAFLGSIEGLNLTYPSIVVINECCSELRVQDEITAHKDKYNSILFVIIADESSEEQPESKCQAEKRTDSYIIVSSREKVNDDIGDKLERIVLKIIKPKCENVNKWLNDKKHLIVNKGAKGASRKRGSFEASSEIKVICHPKYAINDKENDKPCQSSHTSVSFNGHVSVNTKDNILQMNDKFKGNQQTGVQECSNEKCIVIDSTSSSVSERLQHVDRDIIESLLAEMVALYNNSRVPKHERPDISHYEEKEISEKLKTELFDISSVRGVGYRFTCFVVLVERGEEVENQHKIRSVLKENGISDYEIQSVQEQRHYCRAGNKIRATQICLGHDKPVEGTLGCFATYKSSTDTNMCALVAMHVAKCCDSFYISSSSTSEIQGQVIKASVVDTGLDIAALKVDQNIKICAKFKTETMNDQSVSESEKGGDEFELLQGKLHHYCDHHARNQSNIVCNGQNVYIWGGVSKPGKGVITMRKYQHDGMKALIQIEDRVPSTDEAVPERFSYPGDSGAVVCAEDSRGKCVHILAMLIGILNETEIETNPKLRGKYLAVPLSSGLEELKERTGLTFEICESIDS